MPAALRHITLTTGHARRSGRGEIGEAALAACRDLVAHITAGAVAEPARIPGVGDYHLSGRAAGDCLVVTVWHGIDTAAPIATVGVARTDTGAADLWRALHRWGETPVATSPDRCPPAPWVGAAIDRGALAHVDALTWLGDFERCLGWAWLSLAPADCPRCAMQVIPIDDRGDLLCPHCRLVLALA